MKKIVLIAILIFILSVYPLFNIMGISQNSVRSAEIDLSEGNEVIKSLSGYDVKKAQKNVNIAEKEREHIIHYDGLGMYESIVVMIHAYSTFHQSVGGCQIVPVHE